jgi:hypothetical protein
MTVHSASTTHARGDRATHVATSAKFPLGGGLLKVQMHGLRWCAVAAYRRDGGTLRNIRAARRRGPTCVKCSWDVGSTCELDCRGRWA